MFADGDLGLSMTNGSSRILQNGFILLAVLGALYAMWCVYSHGRKLNNTARDTHWKKYIPDCSQLQKWYLRSPGQQWHKGKLLTVIPVMAALMVLLAVLILSEERDVAPGVVLFLIVGTVCMISMSSIRGNAYSVWSDALSGDTWPRGASRDVLQPYLTESGEDIDAIVRSLYQFKTFSEVKCAWPFRAAFALGGAIIIASVLTTSESWTLRCLISFLVVVLAITYYDSHQYQHGEVFARSVCQALFIAYLEARAATQDPK
jgi:hypothetical protein